MDRWKVDGKDVGPSGSTGAYRGVTLSSLLHLSWYIA